MNYLKIDWPNQWQVRFHLRVDGWVWSQRYNIDVLILPLSTVFNWVGSLRDHGLKIVLNGLNGPSNEKSKLKVKKGYVLISIIFLPNVGSFPKIPNQSWSLMWMVLSLFEKKHTHVLDCYISPDPPMQCLFSQIKLCKLEKSDFHISSF